MVGLFTIAAGWSEDSIALATWIGLFCLTAWVFVGLPLAIMNPRFPTAWSVSAAIVLSGLSGLTMIVVAFRPTVSSARAWDFFVLGGFLAAAVAMAAYILLSRVIVRFAGRSLDPDATAGRTSTKRLIAVLLGGGAVAGFLVFPLSLSLLCSLESRRTVVKMMAWEPFVEDATPGRNGVLLRFVDAPNYYLIEYMPGLLEHLQASAQRTIPVEFLTRSDYRGKFRGFRVVRIDGMPCRPDPRYNARSGEGGAPSPGTRRHPLDIFE
ncbi:MAG: hypothetical protein ACM3S5_01885 [Rhodospirillales bacterium]